MKKIFILAALVMGATVWAQEEEKPAEATTSHGNTNKFRQLYQEFSTPNEYRAASGAPGHAYYQQRADYNMDITLNEDTNRITGRETIKYTNNSPDHLEYLWVQLDQNVRAADSKSPLIEGGGTAIAYQPGSFVNTFGEGEKFQGGFNIQSVTDSKRRPLKHMINRTMMRVEMDKDLAPGESFEFNIAWDYLVPDHTIDRARSGYEVFEDGNKGFVIAQFYPRMAVYNDVEGWQNSQFWGRDEFALPFGTFEVNITVPADHMMEATGKLQNRKEAYTKTQMRRYEQALESYDKPVIIYTQDEAAAARKGKSNKTKTWRWKADMVRDFGWASSRAYITDMMPVKINGVRKMAISQYPSEGNPLWEDWSTRVVASTLESYSRMTFDYPYHKAISVHAKNQGMEYPMICWNYGRPDKEGKFSDRTKYGMMSVIIHEVGHNFFPMIVNSDERQWTWMDEGLNTFVQYVAEQDFGEKYPAAIAGNDAYPSRRGPAKNIVPYMSGDQRYIAPIMTKGLNTYSFGANAYAKPGTGLNILRETVMGRELFDYAFRTYSQRWMFKHPSPEDFFRSMEDASAMDLDWFWRGWFYTTDYTDIGVKDVKTLFVSSERTQAMKDYMKDNGISEDQLPPLVYLVEEGSDDFKESMRNADPAQVKGLKEYMMDNMTPAERNATTLPKFIYEITFEKPGPLVMPLIVEYTYADGTSERVTHPAQIWRKNDTEISLVKSSSKAITNITVDPNLETADIDTSNNSWPKTEGNSEFDQMKSKQ